MLSYVRAVGTSFLGLTVFCLQYLLFVQLLDLPGSVLEHLSSSDDAIFALRVGALDEDKPFFNVGVNDGRYACGADRFLAAWSL